MPEVTINIAQRTYRLAVSKGEESLIQECAEKLDRQIASMKENSHLISQEQVAVLVALEIAYEAQKALRSTEPVQEVKEKSTAVSAEELFESLKEKELEIDTLKSTVADLQKQLKEASQTPNDSALLREIDTLSSLCEKAIYSDMHKIGIF